MDINGGQLTQSNGNPVWPCTVFTGPVVAGNVVHSDGTGNLAGVGETTGTANQGYCVMAQSGVVDQSAATSTPSTTIVIPAQSQITGISLLVNTAWTNSANVSIGATAGTTAATCFTATSTSPQSTGLWQPTPTTAAQIANWNNVSNSTFQTGGAVDVEILLTSSATGAGSGMLTVFYIPGINNATPS